MQKFSRLGAASVVGLMLTSSVLAQPRPYNNPPPSQGQFQQGGRPGRGPGPAPQYGSRSGGGQYYYNGRWVDSGEWERHNAERERWARDYQRRRGRGRDDNSSSLIAGIIGFALGAAIVGSTQQAERARAADAEVQARCARRYRSYDRASGTYLGFDGVRHYCQ
jgi:hypothetical protein